MLSPLLLPSLLVLVSASAQQLQGSRQCYKCASKELKSRWDITGLPSSILPAFVDCNSPDGTTPRDACSGACFTYIFDDPDSPLTDVLYVRGCHDQMVGVVSDRMNSGGSSNGAYCEYDSSFSRPDSHGTMVSVKTLAEFCTDDNCNKRKSFPLNGANDCTGQTYNSTVDGQILNCYQCNKDNWNCNEGQCNKKYCSKAMIALEGGGYSIRKTCSNVNILGVDNACSRADIVAVPGGGVAVTMKYTQCYCKDKQNCNGSPSFLSALSSLLVVAGAVGLANATL